MSHLVLSRNLAFISAILSLFVLPANAEAPQGWLLAGGNPNAYEVGKISTGDDSSAAYLKSIEPSPTGFGTLMQQVSARSYLGQRLKLSGQVKATQVTGWSGLWMRIDGPGGTRLGFDNMQSRPIVGTTEMTTYEIVLEVPEESELIAFGILLAGGGEVLLDNIRFESVDDSVSVTGSLAPTFPSEPLNLDFED